MTGKEVLKIKRLATDIRIHVLDTILACKGGHFGGSFSEADLLAVLYSGKLKVDPKNPQWEDRDYLVLSKGHAGPALYCCLALNGFFPVEKLHTMNKLGTMLPSHVDRTKTPGIDMTAGSLGQGASCALGIALGLKAQGKKNTVITVVGDGEAQEGQIWETINIAPAMKLDNFIMIIDDNKQQLDDFTDNIVPMHNLRERAELAGWYAIDCDGHDYEAISDALDKAYAADKPAFIDLHTIKGKGWKEMEANKANHGARCVYLNPEPSLAQIEVLKKELEEIDKQIAEMEAM